MGDEYLLTFTCSGIIAGLAGITPASGYINPLFAPLVGCLIGIGSYYGIIFFKGKLRIDDALDVSSVHGLPGIIGSVSSHAEFLTFLKELLLLDF